jgi:hypothetical protein
LDVFESQIVYADFKSKMNKIEATVVEKIILKNDEFEKKMKWNPSKEIKKNLLKNSNFNDYLKGADINPVTL